MEQLDKETSWTEDPGPGGISLILVGDTNVQNREVPESAFALVSEILNRSDVVFGQMEGPLCPPSTDPDNPDIAHKLLWRHSDPAMVKGYKAANFKAVACASNVCYPPRAALNSIRVLNEAGVGHCGAGKNIEEARRPAIVECRGIRIGFLSYTSVFWPVNHAATPDSPGCATIRIHTGYQPDRRALEMPGAPPLVLTVPDEGELRAMVSDVSRLKEQCELVVVSCHWGLSGQAEVVDYQRVVGRAAINAGADIVFGHHPHVIQAIERYRSGTICYSLGNFAFDWPKMRGRHLDGIMVRVICGANGVRQLAVMPVRRNQQNLVEILDSSRPEGKSIVERVKMLSQPWGTVFKEHVGGLILIEPGPDLQR